MGEQNQELPNKYDPQAIEEKWKQTWEDENTYKWDPTITDRNRSYSVDTPPPTVSGSLHLGHIFSYTQTDLIVRYQRMKGKNIFYPMGWDDNGLPTERRVQNVFGVQCDLNSPFDPNWKPNRNKGKKDPIEHISRSNFIELCGTLTKEDEEVFKHLFTRLALSVDWSLEYATIDDRCRKTSQYSFLDLVQKNQAYSKEAPTLWDVDFQTAVAQAEVEDREVDGFYHDIRFKVEEGGEFIISTTRPELLSACIAVVAHPEDERFKNLFGKHAITPLFHAKVPILPSEHADPEKGSGILMVCTFGDTADIDWWKQQANIPLKQIIGANGRLIPVEFGKAPFHSLNVEKAQKNFDAIKGLNVKQAAKKTVELLKDMENSWDGKQTLLVGELKATRRPVKFYEKGDRPLEFLSTRQWFVHILKHKEDLLKFGSKIKWQPHHMRARYDNWVEGLNQDWCISRQRYFGVPFPVWYPLDQNLNIDYSNPIFADKAQLPVDPLNDTPPGYKEVQRGQKGGFVAEKDVMDTWATSSMSPQVVTRWPDELRRHEALFPMDLRPQSHEIIRTWAFYTIVKAYLHEKKIPWEQIAISGWILDPDRKKMSKSKGNVVTPEKFLDQFGGDPVRYWAARAKLGMDTAFDENLFKMGKKLCNKIFNASKFVLQQVQTHPSKQDVRPFNDTLITEAVDQSWANKMKILMDRCSKAYEENDYALALQLTEDHFWNFCDHYLELVKVRSYSESETDLSGKLSALETLDWSLHIFLKLFAPFFPYLTEEVWSWRYSSLNKKVATIHKQPWPHAADELKKVDTQFGPELLSCATQLLGKIRSTKTQNQKKLKWPVESLEIKVSEKNKLIITQVIDDVKKAGNVSEAKITTCADDAISDDQFCVMDQIILSQEDS